MMQDHRLAVQGGRASGLTLLEVLIAIFIVAVGLAGVFALIPVARMEVSSMERTDRAAQLGQLAWRELKTRDILRPQMWLTVVNNNNQSQWTGWSNTARQAFALDPIGVDRAMQIWASPAYTMSFPAGYAMMTANAGDAPLMKRQTLRTAAGIDSPMNQRMAEQIFTGKDDLLFQQSVGVDGKRTVSLIPSDNGQTWSYQGNYSWLVTCVPSNQDVDVTKELYKVSVLVFDRRPIVTLDPNAVNEYRYAESVVDLQFSGSQSVAFSGGDAILFAPTGATALQASNLLNVKAGEWLLVFGWVGSATDTTLQKPMYEWYEIVAAESMPTAAEISAGVSPMKMSQISSRYVRRVTLRGPNWPLSLTRNWSSGTPSNARVFAGLFPGLVGVYEKTHRFD